MLASDKLEIEDVLIHAAADVPVKRDQPEVHLLPRREDESAHVRQQRHDTMRGLGGNFGE